MARRIGVFKGTNKQVIDMVSRLQEQIDTVEFDLLEDINKFKTKVLSDKNTYDRLIILATFDGVFEEDMEFTELHRFLEKSMPQCEVICIYLKPNISGVATKDMHKRVSFNKTFTRLVDVGMEFVYYGKDRISFVDVFRQASIESISTLRGENASLNLENITLGKKGTKNFDKPYLKGHPLVRKTGFLNMGLQKQLEQEVKLKKHHERLLVDTEKFILDFMDK